MKNFNKKGLFVSNFRIVNLKNAFLRNLGNWLFFFYKNWDFVLLVLISIPIIAFFIMVVWNSFVPDVSEFKQLTYVQSLKLYFLCMLCRMGVTMNKKF